MSIELRDAGYRYPAAPTPALEGVSLTVDPGEVVLLTGPTGCGKSTLLRLAAGLLQRHGEGTVSGSVSMGGADPATATPAVRVRQLGFVCQEPGDQLVTATIGDEVAFAMESAAFPPADIDRAIPGLLDLVGLDLAPDRSTAALSGGQTQRLVTAAALSAGAPVLLLDEPLAQLDPAGALALLERLRTMADAGRAILLVEHRLEPCWPFVDRMVVVDEGRVVAEATMAQVGSGHPVLDTLRRLGLTVPGVVDLADRLAPRDLRTVEFSPPSPRPPASAGRPLISCTGLRHRYEGSDSDALDGVDLAVGAGERVALVGANGAGKSTLLATLAGRLDGAIRHGRVVEVPQDPDLALFCPTVRDELAHGPSEQRLAPPEVAARVAEAAAALSVEDLLDRPPQALSRGQRLRVATAAALSCRPDVLLLDEPTSGQDRAQVERMMAAVTTALSDGAVILATHDLDLALRHATRVVVLDAGRVVADDRPEAVLPALPAALPLPSLAAFCLERGLPPLDAADLAELA